MPIRPAQPTDARGIAEAHVAAWRCAYRNLLPDTVLDNLSVERGTNVWKERLTQGTRQGLVFEQDGGILGFVTYAASRDDDADPERVGEIRAIYLHPRAWRKGYGSALAEAAMEVLKDQGFSEVTLWVLEGNERGRAFYAALGFEPDGAQKVEVREDGVELHEVRYHRLL